MKPWAEADSAGSMVPCRSWPVHRAAGQAPCRLTWSKVPVARVGPPLEDPPPSDVVFTEYPGEAANNPACVVDGSPDSVAAPTRVQCAPSAES